MSLYPKNIDHTAKNVVPELMWTGGQWCEGACWLPSDGKFLFSDVITATQYVLDPATKTVSVFRSHSGFGNGSALDPFNKHCFGFYPPELQDLADYVVVSCEHGRRCLSVSLPPHAMERYFAKYGYDPRPQPKPESGEELGKSRKHAIVPPYMMITNKILTEKFMNRRYNSPNDVAVRPSDGTIWFTDPPYGIMTNKEGYAAGSQINNCHVFCLYPSRLCRIKSRKVNGKPAPVPSETFNNDSMNIVCDEHQMIRIAVVDCLRPNGVAFSADGSKLFVADTSAEDYDGVEGRHDIRVFDVVEGEMKEFTRVRKNKEGEVEEECVLEYRELKAINGRVFCEVSPGVPDGFRVDADGYLFTSSLTGLVVYDPEGNEVNRIITPERTSNCTFGGPDGSDVYITADHSIYRLRFGLKK